MITSVTVEPGMSDHNVVVAEINLKAKVNKKSPRKVFLYKIGNMDNVRTDIKNKLPKFLEDHKESTVETSWSAFKSTMVSVMEDHIPSKTISGRWDIPWMNRDIKEQIRSKQRLYKKAKNTRLQSDWCRFKTKQQEVRDLLDQSHKEYLDSLLTFDNSKERERVSVMKKFWNYVNSKRRDRSGVSPLLKNNKEVSDSRGKAEILNEQYDSVFTNEDIENMPTMPNRGIPSLPDIDLNVNGITKLLHELNPNEANGPDQVPTRVLKEAATEIAPYLLDIFRKSIVAGKLPSDWLTANISPIF